MKAIKYLAVFTAIAISFSVLAENPYSVISINFRSDLHYGDVVGKTTYDGSLAGDNILSASWNEYSAGSVTDAAVSKIWRDGATATFNGITLSYSGAGGYYPSVYNETAHRFMNAYIDDSSTTQVKIDVAGIPYTQYDVIVYMQGDGSNNKFKPIVVNGTNYAIGEDGVGTATTDDVKTPWGQANLSTLAFGTNAAKITGLTSTTLSIRPGNDETVGDVRCRGGVAAIQIVCTGTIREVMDKTFEYVAEAGQSPTGWFSSWDNGDGNNFVNTLMASGPSANVYMTDSQRAPYQGGGMPTKNTFTFCLYANVDLVTTTEGPAVLWAMGRKATQKTMLVKDSEGHIKLVSAYGSTISQEVDAGTVSAGYHLFTATFDTSTGATLTIDNGTRNVNAAFTTASDTGIEIGSILGNPPSGFVKGMKMAVARLIGYDKVLSASAVTELAGLYPVVTTLNYDIDYSVSGGTLTIVHNALTGSRTFTSGANATVIYPINGDATIKVAGEGTFTKTGTGTLTIQKNSSGYNVDATTVSVQNGKVLIRHGEDSPTMRAAKFIIGANGELDSYGWMTYSGGITFENDTDKGVFNNCGYNAARLYSTDNSNVTKNGAGMLDLRCCPVTTGALVANGPIKFSRTNPDSSAAITFGSAEGTGSVTIPNAGVVTVGAGGSVAGGYIIEAGGILKATSGYVSPAVSGSGTFRLMALENNSVEGSRDRGCWTSIKDSSKWTGTVLIEGLTLNNSYPGNMGNEDSILELKNTSGCFVQNFGGVEVPLKITGTCNFTDGESNARCGFKKLIGEGTIVLSNDSVSYQILVNDASEFGGSVTVSGAPSFVVAEGDDFISGHNGKVFVDADKTLRICGRVTGTITGSGTLLYDNSTNFAIPSGLQGDAWQGIFWIKGRNINNFDFGAWGKASGGKLKFTGVTGYAPGGENGCAAEIILADEGDTKAFTITGGNAGSFYDFYKLSGSGTFCTTASGIVAQYRFRDFSGFNGTIGDVHDFGVTLGAGAVAAISGKVAINEGVGIYCAANLDADTIVFNCAETMTLPTNYTIYSGSEAVSNFILYNKDNALWVLKQATPIEPGKTDPEVSAETEAEAKAKVEIAVPTAVADAGIDQTAYKALFQKKATEISTGVWKVEFELTPEALAAEQTKVNAAAAEVVEDIKDHSMVFGKVVTVEEVTDLTPGFYYEFAAYDKDANKQVIFYPAVMADKNGKITNAKVPYATNENNVKLIQVNSYVEEQE